MKTGKGGTVTAKFYYYAWRIAAIVAIVIVLADACDTKGHRY